MALERHRRASTRSLASPEYSPSHGSVGAVHQFERMAGVLVQMGSVHQEIGIAAVAFHLLLQDGIQIRGIVQGIETGQSLVIKKKVRSAVLVVVFVKLF